MVDGGADDDSIEFGAVDMAPGAGVGADDLRGGTGVDRLSYNDHPAAIRVAFDEQPNDGSAGEGDNVHTDVETLIATTLDDVLIGDGAGQDLYGHAGNDTVEGRGGNDLVNGGSGRDHLYGGDGDDGIQGSAGGDYLEGGSGSDYFEGDNECVAQPCTGGPDEIQARDEEEDTVYCGVGADRAVVDALDGVAIEGQHACETIDRSADASPGATPPPPPLRPAAAGQALGADDDARGAAVRVLSRLKLGTLRKRGLRIAVACPSACRIRARLIYGRKVVASARRVRRRAGVYPLTLKTPRGAKRRLGRHKRANMTLVVDTTDAGGARAVLRQPLTFKR